ncbi:MAG: FecR domain-containing protein [Hyphomicrobiales bacterium]|nr:FecR domain-containing protein [Hyphomicrobiales bacterium]
MGPNQSRITRLLTLLLSTVAPMSPVLAQNFAKVGAVNPNAMGTPPGGADRTLTIGTNIVVKERVRTTDAGSTQLLFPDQSTLNLGSNSDMVIDEYFYDPAGKSGTMVASATKGVLRYVGGQISHTSGVTIMTPSAVLGIRGGIATLVLQRPECVAAIDPKLKGGPGCELIINHFGSITIKNNVSTITLSPGQATVVTSANQPIAPPFKVSDVALQQIMQAQTSRPGQSGGNVTRFGNAAGRSFSPPPNFVRPLPFNRIRPPGADPLGYTSVFSAGAGASRNKLQTNQVQSVVPQAQSAAAKMQNAKSPPPPPSYP